MQQLSGVLVLVLILYLTTHDLFFDGIRSFYCLSNEKCITVWKKKNGEVYIIPGKYEDYYEPSVSHIKTINKQFLTLYFSEELPQKIVIRDEGNLESKQKKYTIVNRPGGNWEFLEYSTKYKVILYEPDAIKHNDVKLMTDYLTINIQERYAIDKAGNTIHPE